MIKETSNSIHKQVFFYSFLLISIINTGSYLLAQTPSSAVTASAADKICGKWISEQKNCIVQVYKAGNEYGAKLVWFDDADDKSKPMNTRLDYKNPDKNLQNRKLIGMDVVDNLTYNSDTNTWENGMIYDAKSGRTWSSAVSLTPDGLMKVTGYWKFKFIGKSMNFKRL